MAETTGFASEPTAAPFNFKQAISQMVQRGGSDLHLKVGRPPTIRVNGDLHSLPMLPVRPEELKHLAEQIMTPRQVKEFAEKKEADMVWVTGLRSRMVGTSSAIVRRCTRLY